MKCKSKYFIYNFNSLFNPNIDDVLAILSRLNFSWMVRCLILLITDRLHPNLEKINIGCIKAFSSSNYYLVLDLRMH